MAARAELDFLHALVERWPDAPDWATTMVTVAEAEQLVCEHRPEQARQLMESVPESPRGSVGSQQWRGFYGRLLIDFQEPLEARAVVAPVIADAGEWPIGVVALVVDALAAESLGLRDEALDTLTSALAVTARERVFQPFVASGRQLRPLFQELLDRGSAYEAEVLEILDRVAAREDHLAPLSKYYVDPLTPRELEVLHELQGTESAGEVADRLFVSLNTLRTHIKHINRKLDTTSRRTAVLRARELGIL
jgi:LuxR family maltose regulon positive regulatory protein